MTVFFGSLVAGSVASQLRLILEQPMVFLQTLGTAAPLTSIFFLNYIELNVRVCVPSMRLNCGFVTLQGQLFSFFWGFMCTCFRPAMASLLSKSGRRPSTVYSHERRSLQCTLFVRR